MELIQGGSLQDLVRRHGRLPVGQVAAIGGQVLAALSAAHERGIVHRDIKPANVLLEGDRAVLTDFGIAMPDDDVSLTRPGTLLGTPAFMAPEQVRGRRGTPQSDLWSPGATLYAAVEGHSPFSGPNQGSVFVAIAPAAGLALVAALTAGGWMALSSESGHHAGKTGRSAGATATSAPRETILSVGSGCVFDVAFALDGKSLASAGEDGTIRLWDVATRRVIATLTDPDEAAVDSPAFSPDGKLLASGSDDHTIRLWDTSTHRADVVITGGEGGSIAFSPDGTTLAARGGDDTKAVRLWSVGRGDLVASFAGHTDVVYPVAFSPDGRTLASGADDHTIRLWKVS